MVGCKLQQGLAQYILRLVVNVARHLVEQKHRRIPEHRAGNGDALAHATRKQRAGLAGVCRITVGEIKNAVMGAGESSGGDDLFLARIGVGDRDVVADTSGKQPALLRYIADPAGQLTACKLMDVGAIECHAAIGREVKPLHEL